METKLKIVVADDVKVIAENMQSVIAKNPRVEKVLTAFDGEDEVIKIMNLKPDIVFTDMQMPKKTGLEVIEEIKGKEKIEQTRYELKKEGFFKRLLNKNK